MNRMTEAEQIKIRKALLDTSDPLTLHSGVDIMRAALHASNTLNELHDLGFRSLRIVQGKIIGVMLDSKLASFLAVGLRKNGAYERSYTFCSYLDAVSCCETWDGMDHPFGEWLEMIEH